MKAFVVFIQICSNLSNTCSGYFTDSIEHKTYKECVVHGLTQSNKIVKEFDSNVFNDDRIIIKFHCIEEPSKKQKV